MTLVIEDGTIVTNANSYSTLTEARAYAAARGVTLSAVDATLEIDAIIAMDYLESKRGQYQGTRLSTLQCLQFPREDVYIDGELQDSAVIPKLLKDAQCRLMMEIKAGVNLTPTRTEAPVKSETVGPLSKTYSDVFGGLSPVMLAVDALLEPLFKSVGAIRVVRV